MRVEPARAGLFVQIGAPPFTEEDIPEVREEGIGTGLAAANRLLEWYVEVSTGEARRLELAVDRIQAADGDTIERMEPPYRRIARDVSERGDVRN